jgi:hypothetical protein
MVVQQNATIDKANFWILKQQKINHILWLGLLIKRSPKLQGRKVGFILK